MSGAAVTSVSRNALGNAVLGENNTSEKFVNDALTSAAISGTVSVVGYGISAAYNYWNSNQPSSTITQNAGYVNPDGTGGRLGQDMADATANSMSGGCEKALVDYGGSNYNSNYKSFNNTETLNGHFQKHGKEIANVLDKSDYTLGDYLSDANYIINNGQYSSDLNGYVSFMKNDNYGFVGLDRNTGNITTFHIKKVSELIKKAPDLGFGR